MEAVTVEELVDYLKSQLELGSADLVFDEPYKQASRPQPSPVATQAPKPAAPHARPVATPPPTVVATTIQPAPVPTAAAAPQAEAPAQAPDLSRLLSVPAKPLAGSTDKDLEAIESAATLEALHEAIMHHSFYRLGPEKPGRIAFGSGPIHPSLMIVDYKPNEDELRMGAPVPGPAAELLRKMLELLGISRNLCYYTWFVKKPQGRDPLSRELAVYRRMFAAEVRLVRPTLLLVLGEPAAKAILQVKGSIIDEGGKPLDFAGVKATAIIHPQDMSDQAPLKAVTWKTHIPRSGYFRPQGS